MTEADYQFHIRQGFRIIRKVRNILSIEMKKAGSPGWKHIEKCKSEEHLDDRFKKRLEERKTLADL